MKEQIIAMSLGAALTLAGIAIGWVLARMPARLPGPDEDTVPVTLSPGQEVTDPDEAEALGLTIDARRMRGEFTELDDAAAAVLVNQEPYRPDAGRKSWVPWREVDDRG